jgi:NADPH:quinone reductase-like Zn-dependent oxidoreductase
VLKPGGTVISITGLPDPAFAGKIGANPVVRPVMDPVFGFGHTREAMAHLEQGHTKTGKVVIRVT